MTVGKTVNQGEIQKSISWIQKIYLTLLIIFFLRTLAILWKEPIYKETYDDLISMFVFGTAYYGPLRKRSWVIPLILIASAYSIFWRFVDLLQPANDFSMLISKFLGVLLIFFFAYQIIFFRKNEVNLYFGARGRLIF